MANNGYVANSEFYFEIIFPAEVNGPGGTIDELVLDSVTHGLDTPVDCASIATASEHEASHYHVQISAELTLPVVFMRVLGFNTIDVGIPATAKRTALFDIALVMDESLSMNNDTCTHITPYPVYYACENRYECDHASPFFNEEFDYLDLADMTSGGVWNVNGTNVVEYDSIQEHVHIFRDPAPPFPEPAGYEEWGALEGTIDLTSYGYDPAETDYLALYFDILNDTGANGLDSNGYSPDDDIEIFWQSDFSSPWERIMTVAYDDIDDSDWTTFGIILNLDDMYDDHFQVRFELSDDVNDGGEGFFIDNVRLVDCPQNGVLSKTYVYNGNQMDCYNSYSANCSWDDQLPGESYSGGSGLPVSELLEQPMTSVIRGAQTFIEMIDQRFLDSGLPVRQDYIALIEYGTTAEVSVPLSVTESTNSYDTLRTAIWNMSGRACPGCYTNIGGGMRVGLIELANGRPYTTHFMILLTDGVFTAYDRPELTGGCHIDSQDPECYDDPGSMALGQNCGYGGACNGCYDIVAAMIERARRENVTIFTIGVGEAVHTTTWSVDGQPTRTAENLLEEIANNTTGQYFYAPTSDTLEEIFEWIAEAIFVRLTL
jgi:hypothetical protein